MRKLFALGLLPLTLAACSPEESSTGDTTTESTTEPEKTDKEYQTESVDGMHDLLLVDIKVMIDGAKTLQAAAPTPPDRGWDAQLDADAIAKMKAAWIDTRAAYERIEGALAPLFPNIDAAIDARYDDFLTQLAAQGGDKAPFDGEGVTGMHAIERIIYSDTIPSYVVGFEATLPGYVPAAFPATAAEAADFKAKLCAQFISDSEYLEKQWTPANIDVAIAFQGLISLVNEQREKVNKAASFEEESRYSQRTMSDLRENLVGSKAVYAVFQPWILSKADDKDPKKDGKAIDAKILEGFEELDAAYALVKGDGIPQPPATWSSVNPTADDLKTPFGKLYTSVSVAVDPEVPESIVAQLHNAADLLGFQTF